MIVGAVNAFRTRLEAILTPAGYDVLVLDWNLPDGSGLQLCRDLVSGVLPSPAPQPGVLGEMIENIAESLQFGPPL